MYNIFCLALKLLCGLKWKKTRGNPSVQPRLPHNHLTTCGWYQIQSTVLWGRRIRVVPFC